MMRVAIVHDWLTGMRGGERVLEAMIELFPHAEIFTLFHVHGSVSAMIEARPIHESFLSRAPFISRYYRHYLPLMPLAIEMMPIRGFDLVLSSSHCVAKAARSAGTPHLCYCHTPMRYVWDQFDAYFSETSSAHRLVRGLAKPLAAALRCWDAATSQRVDSYVANSAYIRERIRRCYGRDAAVVHPPVELDRFHARRAPEDFYLVVSALVPYKNVDLAIRGCSRTGRRLVVVGDGPEAGRLRRLAGPTITFKGHLPDDEVADLYSRCRALLFPGVEDFGITAVEAQAAGAPVIALAAGGVLESVAGPVVGRRGEIRDERRESEAETTGVFFAEPDVDAMAAAILHSERVDFDDRALRASAARFAPSRFREDLLREITLLLTHRISAVASPRPVTAR